MTTDAATNPTQETISVGIRFGKETGLGDFGVEFVNGLLNRGGVVTSVEGGGALMRRVDPDDESSRMYVSGFELKVHVDVGAVDDSEATQERDRQYELGCDLIRPYMELVDTESRPTDTEENRAELERGIAALRAVLEIDPSIWAAHWTIGKAYQALGDSEAACESFHRTFRLHDHNADVCREYMFECLNLGRADKAIEAAEHAVRLEPENAGLHANLGLARLIGAKHDAAREAINRALELEPDDPITVNLSAMLADVVAGRKPQPNTLGDLG